MKCEVKARKGEGLILPEELGHGEAGVVVETKPGWGAWKGAIVFRVENYLTIFRNGCGFDGIRADRGFGEGVKVRRVAKGDEVTIKFGEGEE